MRIAVAAFAACACSSAPSEPDAACPPPAPMACVDEGDEDCDGCWRQIGACCYGDPTILDRHDPLVAVCKSQPSCATCCNECAALSCDELRARDLCPNPPDTQPDLGAGDAGTMSNGWTTNAWVANGYGPLQGLRDSLLDGATFDEKRFNDLLANDAERLFIKYVVQCALPAGAVVKTSYQGTPLEFDGALGLAPEWATAPLDEAGQEWVTACMFARNNYYGIPVALSMRGTPPSLAASADELAVATVEEGAFFGNMFADPWWGWACRGKGDDPVLTVVRRCTFADPGAGYAGAPPSCWFYQQGTPCDQVCDGRTDAGAFLECRGTLPDAGAPTTFTRVITTFLKRDRLGRIAGDAGCP